MHSTSTNIWITNLESYAKKFKILQNTSKNFKKTSKYFKILLKKLQNTSKNFKKLQNTSNFFLKIQNTSKNFKLTTKCFKKNFKILKQNGENNTSHNMER